MPPQKTTSRFGPGAFRLFLASVVVVHHTFPLRMGAWAVYVFFMLSGYWIGHMWQQKYLHTKSPWLTFFVSRWWRLAPVFMTCTLLGVISAKILHQDIPQVQEASWWSRQILVVGSASANRLLPPSWSLDVEMQFYLLAPVLLTLIEFIPKKARFAVIPIGIIYLITQLIRGFSPETPRLDIYLGCFAAGIWLQQANWRPSTTIAYGYLATFFLLTAIFFVLPASRSGIWVRGQDQDLITSASTFLLGWPHIWWAFGAFLILPFIAHNVNQASPKKDRWLGNLAFPLYMFHWIARDWYYKYVDWSRPMSHNLLILGVSWIAAYLGAIAILTFIDQPTDRMRAKWVARRELTRETPSN